MKPSPPLAADAETLRPTRVAPDLPTLQAWARELGFSALGVARLDLSEAAPRLRAWLEAGWHGRMDYLARHADLRTDPQRVLPGALTALMVTADYTPQSPDWVDEAWTTLADSSRAYVARYALGRDYHKVIRRRLQTLADRISAALGPFGYRAFCDSGPVMEVELARRAALGWRGKHTLLIHQRRGSSFFIGTLYTDLDLDEGSAPADHCGRCSRCISACPTGAIVAPYQLDARRCIAYLTIELKEAIPEPLRPMIGNRVFGCDDCQLACPWNRFAQRASLPDFTPRESLDHVSLIELFSWDRDQFERRTEGSAIRRIGHEAWLRNIAVALGNLERHTDPQSVAAARSALTTRLEHPSAMVREHVQWALRRLQD
jgi:epoxyqueuosine reductase